MMCPTCCKGGKAKGLCPVSFGLALGVVGFIAVLCETLWEMHYGISPIVAALHLPEPTFHNGLMHGLEVLIKGFVLGFFIALLYDFFSCCCFKKFKKCDDKGECGTPPEKK